MKVYVVMYHAYDDAHICGVYSTRRAAEHSVISNSTSYSVHEEDVMCGECGAKPVGDGYEVHCDDCYDYYFTGDVTDSMEDKERGENNGLQNQG